MLWLSDCSLAIRHLNSPEPQFIHTLHRPACSNLPYETLTKGSAQLKPRASNPKLLPSASPLPTPCIFLHAIPECNQTTRGRGKNSAANSTYLCFGCRSDDRIGQTTQGVGRWGAILIAGDRAARAPHHQVAECHGSDGRAPLRGAPPSTELRCNSIPQPLNPCNSICKP